MTEAEEGEEPQEVTKVVKRTLFHRSNAYPQKKVLTFNRYSDDFSFQVFYGDLDFLSAEEKRWVWSDNVNYLCTHTVIHCTCTHTSTCSHVNPHI